MAIWFCSACETRIETKNLVDEPLWCSVCGGELYEYLPSGTEVERETVVKRLEASPRERSRRKVKVKIEATHYDGGDLGRAIGRAVSRGNPLVEGVFSVLGKALLGEHGVYVVDDQEKKRPASKALVPRRRGRKNP